MFSIVHVKRTHARTHAPHLSPAPCAPRQALDLAVLESAQDLSCPPGGFSCDRRDQIIFIISIIIIIIVVVFITFCPARAPPSLCVYDARTRLLHGGVRFTCWRWVHKYASMTDVNSQQIWMHLFMSLFYVLWIIWNHHCLCYITDNLSTEEETGLSFCFSFGIDVNLNICVIITERCELKSVYCFELVRQE